jgi:hypothetical protein
VIDEFGIRPQQLTKGVLGPFRFPGIVNIASKAVNENNGMFRLSGPSGVGYVTEKRFVNQSLKQGIASLKPLSF